MSLPIIHLTEGHAPGVFYPNCPASNEIARAFESRTLPRAALIALQNLGVTISIDGDEQPYLGTDTDHGFAPIGVVVARQLKNRKTGD